MNFLLIYVYSEVKNSIRFIILKHLKKQKNDRSNPEYNPTSALPEREGIIEEARLPPSGELKGEDVALAMTNENVI